MHNEHNSLFTSCRCCCCTQNVNTPQTHLTHTRTDSVTIRHNNVSVGYTHTHWILSRSLADFSNCIGKIYLSKRADTPFNERESEKMATVVGSSFRCRTKLLNLTQFGRCYSTTNTINRTIKQNSKLFCIIGGGLVAFSYAKWTKSQTVYAAFNPKKIKVSSQA